MAGVGEAGHSQVMAGWSRQTRECEAHSSCASGLKACIQIRSWVANPGGKLPDRHCVVKQSHVEDSLPFVRSHLCSVCMCATGSPRSLACTRFDDVQEASICTCNFSLSYTMFLPCIRQFHASCFCLAFCSFTHHVPALHFAVSRIMFRP